MSIPVLTFFNNKGGVGKTTLIYNLAWMFHEGGRRVVIADIDPQANLTSAFLNEDAIEGIWTSRNKGSTIAGIFRPVTNEIHISDFTGGQIRDEMSRIDYAMKSGRKDPVDISNGLGVVLHESLHAKRKKVEALRSPEFSGLDEALTEHLSASLSPRYYGNIFKCDRIWRWDIWH